MKTLRKKQLPSFQWCDEHVSAPAEDAPSLCYRDVTGPGAAASAAFPCSEQF